MSSDAYQLAYEIAPITLVGGMAAGVFGGLLPALSLLNVFSNNDNLDNAFATFIPIPGGSLISNQIATYPLANVATAGNAYIAQPLVISMKMICPARGLGSMLQKQSIIQSLRETLANHCANGGLFHVATPSFFYDYCMLTDLIDVTEEGSQSQAAFRWDFAKPLVTQQQAAGAQNTLMNQLDSGALSDGLTSGPGLAIDPNTQSAPITVEGAASPGAGIGAGDLIGVGSGLA